MPDLDKLSYDNLIIAGRTAQFSNPQSPNDIQRVQYLCDLIAAMANRMVDIRESIAVADARAAGENRPCPFCQQDIAHSEACVISKCFGTETVEP